MAASKRHLRAGAPHAHLTVCGRPVEGREDELARRLDPRSPTTCKSCWRMRRNAAEGARWRVTA